MGNTQALLEKIDHHKVKGDGAKEIGAIFDKFDSTKDGKISHHGKKGSDDYKKLVEAIAAYCLKEYTSSPLEQKDRMPPEKAKQTIQAWVEEILDQNHDGVISKEEFMKNLTKALSDIDVGANKQAQALDAGAAGVAGSTGGTGAPEAGKPAGGEVATSSPAEAVAEAPPPVVSCGGGEGEERAKEEQAAGGEAAAPAAEPPAEGAAVVAAGGKEEEDGNAKAEGRSPQLCSGSCWSRSNGEGGGQNGKHPEFPPNPEKPEAVVNAEAKPKAGEDNKAQGEGVGANGENNGDDKVAKQKKVEFATNKDKAKRAEDAEKPGDCSGCEVM